MVRLSPIPGKPHFIRCGRLWHCVQEVTNYGHSHIVCSTSDSPEAAWHGMGRARERARAAALQAFERQATGFPADLERSTL